MNKNRLALWLLGFGLVGTVQATELVYTPVNPAFGGNPLNGTWLLNNAQAQNDHDDPDSGSTGTRQSALERFTSTLESRLLSQLLTNIEEGNTGSLTTESFIINMIDDGGQLTIEITDRATGEVSEVVVNGLLP
ncbi:curli production assembly protein CsgF [Pseudomonas taiwanensis]|uniref:curli assembly protein CsgF n=1 Tax=Pseudomonas taiwanensis TaxID=470150 RepID=UPI0015BDF89A|nr:curli assembly protein CsgF [Pseudomonas taiwanensis]NWL77613.1 curli production assembly protein CsgF [Pseudomonas taiwanensis]